jgi:hypothetical protein
MFTDINSNDYILKFELQHSEFMRDVLWPEIEFQLRDKGSNKDIIIYKINSPGIKEEITMDEFIYYMHYDVVECLQQDKEDLQISRKSINIKRDLSYEQGRNDGEHRHTYDTRRANEFQESSQKIYQNQGTIVRFEELFGSIQSIRNAVENMKILLTYEPSEEEEEESEVQEEESDTSNIIQEVSTKRFESP